jgi:hypothetical protein
MNMKQISNKPGSFLLGLIIAVLFITTIQEYTFTHGQTNVNQTNVNQTNVNQTNVNQTDIQSSEEEFEEGERIGEEDTL